MNNVISTRVSVFRNLKDFKFENKLTLEQKQEIVEMIQNALKNKMSLLNINNADGNVIKFLNDKSLILPGVNNILVSKNENVVINLFDGEHLTLVSACDGFEEKTVKDVLELSQIMSTKINFAYSDDYGYLMSDLAKIGSGLRIETNIMLSAITQINKIEQVKQNLAKLGYSLKETNFPAVYTLSTVSNLGVGENKILEDFKSTLIKLQDLEIESVKMFDISNHDELLDKIQRSVAIINSAHLLSYDELYNILVNLRMGANLGLISIKSTILNELQKLIISKTNDIVSQSELKLLAERTKVILKGENNV